MNSAIEIWRKTRPLKEQEVQELWSQVIGASVWTVKPPRIMTGLVTSNRAQRQKLHGTRSVQGMADDWNQEKRVVRFNDTVSTLEGLGRKEWGWVRTAVLTHQCAWGSPGELAQTWAPPQSFCLSRLGWHPRFILIYKQDQNWQKIGTVTEKEMQRLLKYMKRCPNSS